MPRACRLYLLSPPAIPDLDAFSASLEQVLAAAPIAAFQLRLKPGTDEMISQTAQRLLPVAAARNVTFILNDRPELAARLACDGVHIGQHDGAVADARRLVGPDRIVGVTCHASRHLAMEAAEAGADYVAFGAFFASSTKAAETRAELELLSIWQESMLTPCVAIGGILPENCGPLVGAGADFLAVSAGVWRHPAGPVAAIRAFDAVLGATPGEGGSLASSRSLH